MSRWRRINRTWCNWPSRPIGLIEMIGGSYLATTPTISYKRLLESLVNRNLAVHAWSYVPSLDHQSQSNQAWKEFRILREKLKERTGNLPSSIRIGHSLGCKLHLIAPDRGRNSKGLIALSFNNFKASNSIPMLGKLSTKFDIQSEFSPGPKETMRIIMEQYIQEKNLLIKFKDDKLDQSESLIQHLQKRSNPDKSSLLVLQGSHLTPASAGFRNKFFGEFINQQKIANLEQLITVIYQWSTN